MNGLENNIAERNYRQTFNIKIVAWNCFKLSDIHLQITINI